MRLLLDTHVFVGLIDREGGRFATIVRWLDEQRDADVHLSTASLWEMAIKWRIGKLRLPIDIADLPDLTTKLSIKILTITPAHVLAPLSPEPKTRDLFDRLLLAQCQIENVRLVTVDRALVDHPLAARVR